MKKSHWKFHCLSLTFLFWSGGILVVHAQAAEALPVRWASDKQTKPLLFGSLEAKMGKVELPDYPANNVLEWSNTQFGRVKSPADVQVASNKQETERLIYEHLLVAEDILQKAQSLSSAKVMAQQQRRVMQLAEAAALRANVVLGDSLLSAQIRETYQLPYLDSASGDGDNNISKEHIVGTISADYANTGQTDKEIAALKNLIVLATTRNSADSARFRLAQAYAATEDYARAVAYLQAIQDPSIGEAKKLIPRYQTLQTKQ